MSTCTGLDQVASTPLPRFCQDFAPQPAVLSLSLLSARTIPTTPPILHPTLRYPAPPVAIMPAFDYCPDRPENIDAILNGLDRYNPETTQIFQEYVAQQCDNQTYDCYANLALLKL